MSLRVPTILQTTEVTFDLQDEQVEPHFMPSDPESNPQLGDGVWRPWVTVADEVRGPGGYETRREQRLSRDALDLYNRFKENRFNRFNPLQ